MNLRPAPCSLYETGTKPEHYTKQWFFRRHVDLVWGMEAYFYVRLGRLVAGPSPRHRCWTGLPEHQRRRDGGEPLCLFGILLEHQEDTQYGQVEIVDLRCSHHSLCCYWPRDSRRIFRRTEFDMRESP